MPRKGLLTLTIVCITVLLIFFAVLKRGAVKRFMFTAMEASEHSLKWAVHWSRYHFNPIRGNFAEKERSVRVEGGFEGSNVINVKEVSRNYFEVMMRPDEPSDHDYPGHMLYWFYFKITGAKDQTVTVDITNADWMPNHWDNYTPVYTYALDPNDLTEHKWEKITNTTRFFTTFSFTHTFTSDSVWVALRYPYTYTYGQRYISSIKDNPYVTVETLGKTREGRNTNLIIITDRGVKNKDKKGIWLIAKDHAVEQDGAWMIEGIIEFLLSKDPVAEILRKKTIFAMVPLAAPDAAYHGRTVNPITGADVSHSYSIGPLSMKRAEIMTEETKAIWSRVQRWVKEGNNVDIAAILHNPHGSEENVWGMFSSSHKAEEKKAFHRAFLKNLKGYTTRTDIFPKLHHSDTFSDRAAAEFDSIAFVYEINMHAKGSFLSIQDLHNIGEDFARGIFDYFDLAAAPRADKGKL